MNLSHSAPGKRPAASRRRPSARLFVLIPCLVAALATERNTWAGSPASLPFSVTVTTRPLNLGILSLYVDSPLRQVVMDGGVWVFGAQPDPYHNPITVPRWKGPDFEHMDPQPAGAADFAQRTASSFINSGLWHDPTTGILYALMHGEYDQVPGTAWCRKKTWLATSSDLGLSWTFVGDVVTPTLPEPGQRWEYSGSEFEMGPADYDLYVDTRSGYFYHTSWNGFVAKNGILNHFTAGTMQVARCAIRDKMAPGKWYKFHDGTWTEPGLGGKASRVGMTSYGIYGNTIYSTYLKKYLRIGVNIGVGDPRFANVGLRDNSVYISTCTDLAKQDWTPMAKLLDEPGNPLYGFTLAAADGIEPYVCGQTLRVYNFWSKSGRILDVTLTNGAMPVAPLPPHGSYSYEPHPESGDPIESRRTRIVGCASPEMRYAGGGWNFENDPLYYRGQIKNCSQAGSSVEFSFDGPDIYWRAIGAQDGGKADVFIDGRFQETVDLCFWDTPLVYQFAYIKTGLNPKKPHTIKIVVRADRHPDSRGTSIKHMGFEHAAESYWAAAGFSSIAGKNQWHYQAKVGDQYRDLRFDPGANVWSGPGLGVVGNDYHLPAPSADAVRKWLAPRDGYVRIEGEIAAGFNRVVWDPVVTYVRRTGAKRFPRETGQDVTATLAHNRSEVFAVKLGGGVARHDLCLKVKRGDSLCFGVAGSIPATPAVNDDNSLITYSGAWSRNTNSAGYFGNDQHFSRTAGNYAEFKFTGTAIRWIGPRNIDCGTAEVHLDGVKVGVVDLFAPAWLKQQVLYESASLPPGPHTLRIVVAADKNPPSSGNIVALDALVYRAGPKSGP